MANISSLLLWILVIIQLVITLMLTKLVSDFLNNVKTSNQQKLDIGSKAPLFREFDQNGNTITLSSNKTLLLFIKDTCKICKGILNEIEKLETEKVKVILISGLSDKWEYTQLPKGLSLIQSGIIIRNYLIENVPTAVLLDEFGYIKANKVINSIEELKAEILMSYNKSA